jgi:transposase
VLPVPDPEVAGTAKRRQFSRSEKRRILAEANRCTEPDEMEALLRREGIYSSNLSIWRKQREATEWVGVRRRGRVSERFKGRIDPPAHGHNGHDHE